MFTKESIRKRRDHGIEMEERKKTRALERKERKKEEKDRINYSLYPGMRRVPLTKRTKYKSENIHYNLKIYPEEDRFRMLKRRAESLYCVAEDRLAFIDFFYSDEQFNTVFNFWVACDRHKSFVPSVDHKISRINGGSDELDNLHFITYAENMWKRTMNWEEWCQFKIDMHLTADFFIRWE